MKVHIGFSFLKSYKFLVPIDLHKEKRAPFYEEARLLIHIPLATGF